MLDASGPPLEKHGRRFDDVACMTSLENRGRRFDPWDLPSKLVLREEEEEEEKTQKNTKNHSVQGDF